jgi:hypothetical protein
MTPTRTWDIDALLEFHRAHFGDARMEGEGDPPAPVDGFKPITTQEELNSVIGDRVKRAKPADYDDLKAKAAKLDQLESDAKPELERLTERASTAEALVSAMPAQIAESLRAHLVELGVVAKEDEVLLTASNPEDLIAQVKRLSSRAADRKKDGNVVPNEGKTPPAATTSDVREFTRGLFGTAN